MTKNTKHTSRAARKTTPKQKGKGKTKYNIEHAGTAIMIDKRLETKIVNIDPISSRLIAVTIKASPSIKIKLISCYAPQADQKDSAKEKIYDQLTKELEKEETTYQQ